MPDAPTPKNARLEGDDLVLIILGLASVLPYVAIYFIIPQFASLFAGFGAELPVLTMFYVSYYKYLGLSIVLGLIPAVIYSFRKRKDLGKNETLLLFAVFGFLLGWLLLIVAVIAMYLPVIKS